MKGLTRPNHRPATGLTDRGDSGMIPGGDLRRRAVAGPLRCEAEAMGTQPFSSIRMINEACTWKRPCAPAILLAYAGRAGGHENRQHTMN